MVPAQQPSFVLNFCSSGEDARQSSCAPIPHADCMPEPILTVASVTLFFLNVTTYRLVRNRQVPPAHKPASPRMQARLTLRALVSAGGAMATSPAHTRLPRSRSFSTFCPSHTG